MDGTRPRPHVELEQPRCPFCHDAVRSGEAQLACNGCRAWHHEACWSEAGEGCAACGSASTGRAHAPPGGEAPPGGGGPWTRDLLPLGLAPAWLTRPAGLALAPLAGVLCGVAASAVLALVAAALAGRLESARLAVGAVAIFLGTYAFVLAETAASAGPARRYRLGLGATLSLVGPLLVTLGVFAPELYVPHPWAWLVPWPYYVAWASTLFGRRPQDAGRPAPRLDAEKPPPEPWEP